MMNNDKKDWQQALKKYNRIYELLEELYDDGLDNSSEMLDMVNNGFCENNNCGDCDFRKKIGGCNEGLVEVLGCSINTSVVLAGLLCNKIKKVIEDYGYNVGICCEYKDCICRKCDYVECDYNRCDGDSCSKFNKPTYKLNPMLRCNDFGK